MNARSCRRDWEPSTTHTPWAAMGQRPRSGCCGAHRATPPWVADLRVSFFTCDDLPRAGTAEAGHTRVLVRRRCPVRGRSRPRPVGCQCLPLAALSLHPAPPPPPGPRAGECLPRPTKSPMQTTTVGEPAAQVPAMLDSAARHRPPGNVIGGLSSPGDCICSPARG